nr:hypothetical protein [Lachnospiraceae bacterium]
MSRYQCPICGNQQEFGPEKAFGFCSRCGTKLALRRPTEETAPEPPVPLYTAPEPSILSPAGPVTPDSSVPLMTVLDDSALDDSAPDDSVPDVTAPDVPAPGAPAEEDFFVPKIAMTETWKLEHLKHLAAEPPEPEIPQIPLTETREIETQEEEVEEQVREARAGRRTGLITVLSVLAAVGLLAAAYFLWIQPAAAYRMSEKNHESGQYQEAIDGFRKLGNYRDSALQAELCWLDKAVAELRSGQLTESARSLAQVKNSGIDTSLYDAVAGSYLQKLLIQNSDYDNALAAVTQLPAGRIKDLDGSFEAAFRHTLDLREYEKAASAFAGFEPYLADPDLIRTMISSEQEALMDAGDYAHALEMSQQFAVVLADPEEDVTARFQTLMEEGQYFQAAALLETFEPQVGNRTYFEKEIEDKLLQLMKDGEDDAVIEMAYAFHDFRNLDMLITLKSSDYLAESAENKNWERTVQIMERYTAYNERLKSETELVLADLLAKEAYDDAEDLIAQLEGSQIEPKDWQIKLTERCIETEDWERAKRLLTVLDGYKGSEELSRELLCQQILKLWDEGKDEEAERLIEELGDTDARKDLLQEAQLRAARALIDKELPSPDEFKEAYTTLYSIRSHEGAAEELTRVLERWADVMLDNVDRRPYLEAMSGMGFVSTANRTHICAYMIEKTPAMAGCSDSGATWMMNDEWLPYNVYRFLEQVSDGTGETRSFIQYAMSMVKEDITFSLTDMWNLWELREDVRALCSSNDYLIFFLAGVWSSEDDSANLTVKRTNRVFSVEYRIPPTTAGEGIRAENFGLVSGAGRLCNIRILGFNTIELTNLADGRTWTLTRPWL